MGFFFQRNRADVLSEGRELIVQVSVLVRGRRCEVFTAVVVQCLQNVAVHVQYISRYAITQIVLRISSRVLIWLPSSPPVVF